MAWCNIIYPLCVTSLTVLHTTYTRVTWCNLYPLHIIVTLGRMCCFSHHISFVDRVFNYVTYYIIIIILFHISEPFSCDCDILQHRSILSRSLTLQGCTGLAVTCLPWVRRGQQRGQPSSMARLPVGIHWRISWLLSVRKRATHIIRLVAGSAWNLFIIKSCYMAWTASSLASLQPKCILINHIRHFF